MNTIILVGINGSGKCDLHKSDAMARMMGNLIELKREIVRLSDNGGQVDR